MTWAPAPAIAHIHDRMPMILAAEAEAARLDAALAFAQVAGSLAPYRAAPPGAEVETPRPPDLFS